MPQNCSHDYRCHMKLFVFVRKSTHHTTGHFIKESLLKSSVVAVARDLPRWCEIVASGYLYRELLAEVIRLSSMTYRKSLVIHHKNSNGCVLRGSGSAQCDVGVATGSSLVN